MHNIWCNIEEVPYYFSRSSIKFQGHRVWKICDLNPIWVRLLGRSQLSNLSDFPCFAKLQNLNFQQIFEICNFDFVLFWLGIQYESMVWVIMGQQGGILRMQVFSSSCSSFIKTAASQECHGVSNESNHWQTECLFSSLFRLTIKKTSKLRITGL